MSVLIGINWEQNSTAALMVNDEIVACISEERLSGVKNDERYPKLAIDWLLREHNLDSSKINKVCFISKEWTLEYPVTRQYTNFSIKEHLKAQYDYWFPRLLEGKKKNFDSIFEYKLDYSQFPGEYFWKKKLKEYTDDIRNDLDKSIEFGQKLRAEVVKEHLGISQEKIEFVNHHEGHAFYAYFGEKVEGKKTLTLTLDAYGDSENYSAWIVQKKENFVEFSKIVSGNNFIIGRLYRYVTLILSMKPNEHEYKLMGLAPYSKAEYSEKVYEVLSSYQNVQGGLFIDKEKPKDLFFSVRKDLEGFRFDAIAGGLQLFTERLIAEWVRNLVEEYQPDSLCIGGGVALNVKCNSTLSKTIKIKDIRIPPTPDDSSQAIGALFASDFHRVQKSTNPQSQLKSEVILTKKFPRLNNYYLGNSFDNLNEEEIYRLCFPHEFKIESVDNVMIAKKIANGEIIGRFSGKAEFGARALGNRSIVADPRSEQSKHSINESIKSRDFWMPFAAVVLQDYAERYLVLDNEIDTYKYMTNACDTTLIGKDSLKGAIHPSDLTCRPQILWREDNPEYYDLVFAFGEITGVFALLNTSFNFHGKPIVGTPEEAISTFRDSSMNGLILGQYFISKY